MTQCTSIVLKRKRIPEEIEEKVDMQTKSYIDDIVSAINRDPKMKGLKPIAQKFKDLAMKTGDVAKSLKDVVTKEIGNTSILRGLTARLLNMSDSIPETQPKFDDTDKEVSKSLKDTANKMVSVAKTENLDLVNAVANVLGEKQIVSEDGHTDVASAIRQCKTMIEDAMQISSKLQTMNPEESLPSWWTNKLAIASNNMNKLRDYFLVPTTEEIELDEKIGDIPDLKNLIGELVKASGMHLAQSKRVQKC